MALSLVYKNGKYVGRRVDVGAGSMTIGRDDECDLVVSAAKVSRRHARLSLDEGVQIVEDLDSSNGTWVNGDKIAGTRELCAGDQLVIGDQYFEICESTRAARPPKKVLIHVLMVVVIVVLCGAVIGLLFMVVHGPNTDSRQPLPPSHQTTASAPDTGAIELVTMPADVEVLLDGEARGRSVVDPAHTYRSLPMRLDGLTVGQYALTLSYKNLRSEPDTITVEAGITVPMRMQLWLPSTRIEKTDGRILFGMVIDQRPNGDLVLAVARDRTEVLTPDMIRSRLEVTRVVFIGDDGVKTTIDPKTGVPELTVDVFPND